MIQGLMQAGIARGPHPRASRLQDRVINAMRTFPGIAALTGLRVTVYHNKNDLHF